jgi:hypothetical protein
MATNKKLAALQLDYGRTIHGLVTIPESDGYLEVQIVKIENPIADDWEDNEVVKISKELIKNVIWKS